MKKEYQKNLLIGHITSTPGPVQFIEEYLKKQGELATVMHPLDNSLPSSVICMDESQCVSIKSRKKPVFRYIHAILINLAVLFKYRKQAYKYVIATNALDAFSVILIRFLLKSDTIVFYNVDFSRNRFSNKVINYIYINVDKFSAKRVDFLFCNTHRTVAERNREGIDKRKILHVPNGVFLKKISFQKSKFNKKLLYLGHVSKDHYLGDIIHMMSKTDLEMVVIGNGPDLKELKELSKRLGLTDRIEFKGLLSHDDVLKFLSTFNGFGIAGYRLTSDWVYYCDPVKVKEYLAFKIPVLIADVPEVAEYIEKNQLGYKYGSVLDLEMIMDKINRMSETDYAGLQSNIAAKQFDYDLETIYDKAFEKINGQIYDVKKNQFLNK